MESFMHLPLKWLEIWVLHIKQRNTINLANGILVISDRILQKID